MVIAIIAVLSSMLMSSLSGAKSKARKAKCTSNLRQIVIAAQLYADDHGGELWNIDGRFPDHGQWTLNPKTRIELASDHGRAYWGLGYRKYIGEQRSIFRCPSAKIVDEWREDHLRYPTEFWLNATYGLNGKLTKEWTETDRENDQGSQSDRVPRIDNLLFPQTTIFVHDSAEHLMEGADDSIGLFPGSDEILKQWRFLLQDFYPEREMWLEWFRHDQQCNIAWLTGSVSSEPFMGFDTGVDFRWYYGAAPKATPRF